MKARSIAIGCLYLLAAAYLDNARGPLLPVVRDELHLSFTQVSLFLAVAYPFAAVLTLSLTRAFRMFGQDRVACLAALLGIATALFAHVVEGYGSFLFFGVLIGCVTAVFGTLCNVYVIVGSDAVQRSRSLCGLHTMYGAGSFLAPYGMALVLEHQMPWAFGFSVWPVFLILMLLGLFWNFGRTGSKQSPPLQQLQRRSTISEDSGSEQSRVRSIVDVVSGQTSEREDPARISPIKRLICVATICAYVGGEVLCSMWMASYFAEQRNLPPQESAHILSGFFVAIFVTRLLGAFFLRPQYESVVMWLGLGLGVACMVIGHLGIDWGFAWGGVVGIFFPVYFSRMSTYFSEIWREMIVWIIAGMQVTLLLVHMLVGFLSDRLPMATVYWLPVGLLAFCMVGLYLSGMAKLPKVTAMLET